RNAPETRGLMIAVSNTTPLNYLILIGAVDVLPQLFDRVLIPQMVLNELRHACTPETVRTWVANPPTWLEVRPVTTPADPSLALLEDGERDAIVLAEQVGADLLLIDEREGRTAATQRGVSITGTLGVLDRAAEGRLLDFQSTIQQLRQT